MSDCWLGYNNGEGLVEGLESVILGADTGEGDGVGANQFEVLKGVQSRRLSDCERSIVKYTLPSSKN